MTHADAIKSLAKQFDHVDWLIFTECSMRSDCIPDLLVFKKSYARAETRIYEVKVTLGDLKQDVKKMKFQKYFDYADRVFFAIGPGIKVDVAKEILAGQSVGIMSFRGDKWVVNVPAPRLAHEKKIDWEFFLALMMGGKQFKPSERYSRIEREHMIVMQDEIKTRYAVHNRALNKKIGELENQRSEMQNMERSARILAHRKLREEFGISKSWGHEGYIRDLFKELVEPQIEAGLKTMKDRICGVLDEEKES